MYPSQCGDFSDIYTLRGPKCILDCNTLVSNVFTFQGAKMKKCSLMQIFNVFI